MVCTIISTDKTRCRGMTLVEVMVATGIGSVVLAAIMGLMFFSARSFAALTNYVDLDIYSRNALDKMSSEIRQANKLTYFAPTELRFETTDPVSGATSTLTYQYDANERKLNRIFAGQTNVLLREITTNSLQFAMYQRNPVGGSVDQWSTADPSQCKVIQMSWICSRDILGKKANTESVQSAKVVIRKQ